MFRGKTVIGIIPARASSKRLPGKNAKKLGNKPLISWTFDAAKKSKYIDRLILTTDSAEISSLAIQQKVEVPFKRPKSISQDSSTMVETITHTLDWLDQNENKQYDYILILQPTSPFRTTQHIDEAIEKVIIQENIDAIVGTNNFSKKASWLRRIDTRGYLANLINKTEKSICLPNGAIYIIKSQSLLKYTTFYPEKTIPYSMDSISSIDIDTEDDFQLAEAIVNSLYEKTN